MIDRDYKRGLPKHWPYGTGSKYEEGLDFSR